MKPETLHLLCSPEGHEPLLFVTERETDGTTKELLLAPRSGRRYPIRDGIPVFVDDSEVTGLNKQYQAVYDRVAAFYDLGSRAYGFLTRGALRKRVLADIVVNPEDRLLEVSIGTGFNVSLLPREAKYFGLEISWGMLRRCQDNMRRQKIDAELFLGNAECLPFRDEVFDVVFHIGGINFFNDKAKAIREMIRVAKSGTAILIGDEMARVERYYSSLPLVGKECRNKASMMKPPVELVPQEMLDLKLRDIYGAFYVITFRKPN